MNGDFNSVREALKQVLPFKGNKQKILVVFNGNVDSAFAVINSSQETILYKFVLMRVSGEPRTSVTVTSKIGWNINSYCKTLT
jgi:hypothetical protein